MVHGEPAEPRRLGRYTLYAEIASGGMATVHLGRMSGARGFSRVVAIKRMLPQFARDTDFVSMFVDEGRLASRISHPNVVTTFDVVRADGELFIVMEYVAGETLERLLRAAQTHGKRVPPAVAVGIAHGILAGLHAAHQATDEDGHPLDIVHRDVSPQNIIVGGDGIPRLLDFGIATAKVRLHSTREGKLKGKLRYLPPEAFSGGSITRTADIYAAAVVLWETLTGRPLFAGQNEAQTLGKILEGRVQPPSEIVPGLTAELDEVVMRGLSRDPAERYPSGQAMARDLRKAAPVAHADEIAEWVAEIAPEMISRHRTAVRDLESGSAPRLLELRPMEETSASVVRGITHSVLLEDDAVPIETTSARRAGRPRAKLIAISAALAAALTAALLVARTTESSEPASSPKPARAPETELVALTTAEPPPATETPSTRALPDAGAAPRASAKAPPPPVRRAATAKRPCSTLKYRDESGIWRVKRDCIK